ncbi:TPA: DUF551 domain-containing protein [Citrobacter farmeri]
MTTNNLTDERLSVLIRVARDSLELYEMELPVIDDVMLALAELQQRRAAMLQGSQPVSNRDELLPSIKPAPELDSVAKNAKSLPSNSPVIPDCWIKCSDRMPEKGQKVFYYFDIVGVHAGYYDGDNTFVKENGGGWLTGDVTHWMEWILPAAPQQEEK